MQQAAGALKHINQFQLQKKIRIIQSTGTIAHVDKTDSTGRK
jgi:hypothetical protein